MLVWSFSISQEPQNSGNLKNHTKFELHLMFLQFPAFESYLPQGNATKTVFIQNKRPVQIQFSLSKLRSSLQCIRSIGIWQMHCEWSPLDSCVFTQLTVRWFCQSTFVTHYNEGWQRKVVEEGRREGWRERWWRGAERKRGKDEDRSKVRE